MTLADLALLLVGFFVLRPGDQSSTGRRWPQGLREASASTRRRRPMPVAADRDRRLRARIGDAARRRRRADRLGARRARDPRVTLQHHRRSRRHGRRCRPRRPAAARSSPPTARARSPPRCSPRTRAADAAGDRHCRRSPAAGAVDASALGLRRRPPIASETTMIAASRLLLLAAGSPRGFQDDRGARPCGRAFTGRAIGDEGGARTPVDARLQARGLPDASRMSWRTRGAGRGGRDLHRPGWRIFVPVRPRRPPRHARGGRRAACRRRSKAEPVIRRGDPVMIEAGSAGFSITREGVALGDAAPGARFAGQGRGRASAGAGGGGRTAAARRCPGGANKIFAKAFARSGRLSPCQRDPKGADMVDPIGVKAGMPASRRSRASPRGDGRVASVRPNAAPDGDTTAPARRSAKSLAAKPPVDVERVARIKQGDRGRQLPDPARDDRRPAARAQATNG